MISCWSNPKKKQTLTRTQLSALCPSQNSQLAPENRPRAPKGRDRLLTIHFQVFSLLVSGRVKYKFKKGHVLNHISLPRKAIYNLNLAYYHLRSKTIMHIFQDNLNILIIDLSFQNRVYRIYVFFLLIPLMSYYFLNKNLHAPKQQHPTSTKTHIHQGGDAPQSAERGK